MKKVILKPADFLKKRLIPSKNGTKTIEKTFEKWELVSLKGVPSLLIRKISGHKTEKAFLEYIKVDEELAAKEMMKYWVNFEGRV